MYDMYPWDSASQGEYPPDPLRSRKNPAKKNPLETSPARSVQVALDRRDNGGDVEAAAVLSAGARPGQ